MPYRVRFSALRVDPRKYDISAALQAEAVDYMTDFCWQIIDLVKTYPPERPGQVYVRTERLLRGWDVEIYRAPDRIEARIVNYATDPKNGLRYMAKVQGAFQTLMHEETGWQRVDLAASEVRREYRRGLQEIYTRFLRRRGIGG